MERIDVVKLVRENQDKFKLHLQKMKEFEEKDKELDYNHMYSNYMVPKEGNNKLTTIPEGDNETHTIHRSVNLNEERERTNYTNSNSNTNNNNKNNKSKNKASESYIYKEILLDSGDEDKNVEDNYREYNEHFNNKIDSEQLSKENDYLRFNKLEAHKNDYRSDESDDKEEKQDNEDKFGNNSRYRSEDEIEENNYNRKYDNNNESNNEKEEEEDNQNMDQHFKYEDNSGDIDIKNKMKKIYDTESDSENEIIKIKPKENKIINHNNKIMMIKNKNNAKDKTTPSNTQSSTSKKITPKFNNNCNPNLARSNVSTNSLISNDIKKSTSTTNCNYETKPTLKNSEANKNTFGNTEKRPYTAFTYSTIKKIKTNPKEVIKKPILFNKQYNGKLDRVALYQLRKTYWDKKPYLNVPVKDLYYTGEDELNTEEKIKLQKLKNIRRPLTHYTKNF